MQQKLGEGKRERGVLYCVWGKDPKFKKALDRSMASVRRHHPELPIEVCQLEADDPVKGLLEKSRMFELSPFAETLFLDVDTVVLDRLDFGFEKARQYGLACAICECPWARRYGGIDGDMVEYNTGVVFWAQQARPVFDAWRQLAPTTNSSVKYLGKKGEVLTMAFNDQAAFAQAIHNISFAPFVLPMNWNFRPIWQRTFFGPIRIWHDFSDVPAELYRLCDTYRRADTNAIIQFHHFA